MGLGNNKGVLLKWDSKLYQMEFTQIMKFILVIFVDGVAVYLEQVGMLQIVQIVLQENTKKITRIVSKMDEEIDFTWYEGSDVTPSSLEDDAEILGER